MRNEITGKIRRQVDPGQTIFKVPSISLHLQENNLRKSECWLLSKTTNSPRIVTDRLILWPGDRTIQRYLVLFGEVRAGRITRIFGELPPKLEKVAGRSG